MDEIVRRAMAKWPNVPAVYGWLALTARGGWRLDGSLVRNRATIDFINRNYLVDERGGWYFQNGPQRVYVDLEAGAPWVVSLDGERRLLTHTGKGVEKVDGVWLDEEGELLLGTERGLALVCDRDLDALSERFCGPDGAALDLDALEAALEDVRGGRTGGLHFRWSAPLAVGFIERARLAERFGFEPRPRGADDCLPAR